MISPALASIRNSALFLHRWRALCPEENRHTCNSVVPCHSRTLLTSIVRSHGRHIHSINERWCRVTSRMEQVISAPLGMVAYGAPPGKVMLTQRTRMTMTYHLGRPR